LKNLLVALFVFSLASFSAAQVTVQVSAPLANSTNTTSTHVQATASSSHPITGWQVYLDSADVTSGPANATLSTSINASVGAHTLVIRAWDSTGAFGSQTESITVSNAAQPASALPTPPSTATVFSNIQQMTSGWGTCNTPSCAGGTGEGSYWQAFNQSSPSLSGRSMELFQDGVWSNVLFYRQMGANDNATNFLLDFYMQVDSASPNATQALEYDAFQSVGGYNFMMGTQCDYGYGVWDTWNESGGQWVHTTIPCKKFATGTWHHIQWYITDNHTSHTYTYHTLVVDGVPYTVNQTQSAKYLAWGDNAGAQWQLDVNASGTGFHEWVDNANLTIW
jgi:hypothetical protein